MEITLNMLQDDYAPIRLAKLKKFDMMLRMHFLLQPDYVAAMTEVGSRRVA
jgi:hypothetical protein